MGALLSLAGGNGTTTAPPLSGRAPLGKRRRTFFDPDLGGDPSLIPDLPDEISTQILARVPRINYLNLRLVSTRWKSVLSSQELFVSRRDLEVTEQWLYLLLRDGGDGPLVFHALDPSSGKWQRLPPMPGSDRPPPPATVAARIQAWFGRPNRPELAPFFGCTTGSAGGSLYVLGGFSETSVARSVWRYDPVINGWVEAAPMSDGRAYCKTAVMDRRMYVVGGVRPGRGGGLASLQSAEALDPRTGTWAPLPDVPFSAPPFFFSDVLKPMATGLCSYRGKLWVPQSLCLWPFFVDVGGRVYDPETEAWGEMPAGMGEGWPARRAGTKPAAAVGGELYALDPPGSLYEARLKVYHRDEDRWKAVIGGVPVLDYTGSGSPYLLAGSHGRLHIVTRDADLAVVVLRADPWCRPGMGVGPGEAAEAVGVVWTVVGRRGFDSAELVGCEVIDV